MNRQLLFRVILACFVVAIFVVSVGFAGHKQAVMPCSGVSVNIHDSSASGFVEASDVRQIIQNKFGTLEGKSLSSINISLLEKIINTNPFISSAEVFSTVDGKINIDVKQRIPVLRVINYKSESFYIDNDGVFMPLSEKFTARVPVASGFIFDTETEKRVKNWNDENINDTVASKLRIDQLFHVACYTHRNEFWNAEAQQFYVNADGDIEMIPRVGNHSVIIGNDENLDDKFSRLLLFYKEGLNKNGWDKYSAINLKYKNQVVCTKK